MTITRLIGDIHGSMFDYQTYCIGNFEGPTIQVGDFGIGLGGSDYWHENVNNFHADGQHRFIRGNHDHPERCRKEMVGYISDGAVEDDVMYIGGAWSIDNPVAPPGWYRRTPGLDWWDDEECSDKQFEQMLETYKQAKPRVMITHDCPASISYDMFWKSGFIKGPVYPNRTSAWLDTFLKYHQPEFHFFGHWHKTMKYFRDGTTFMCLGELDYIDVDLTNSKQIAEAIDYKA